MDCGRQDLSPFRLPNHATKSCAVLHVGSLHHALIYGVVMPAGGNSILLNRMPDALNVKSGLDGPHALFAELSIRRMHGSPR